VAVAALLVSFGRTVCGTNVEKCLAGEPGAEMVLLRVIEPVAVAFCELTNTAQEESAGAMRGGDRAIHASM